MSEARLWGSERTGVDAGAAEQARALSPAERLRVLRSLCRDAGRLLSAMPPEVRQRSLAYRAPLPDSSIKALARLRAEAKRKVH